MEQHQLDFDYTVTKINAVIERMPDPCWKMEKTLQKQHCVLCVALTGEAVYQFYQGEKREMRVAEGDAMFFRTGDTRTAVSVPENPWHFISVNFDMVAYNDKSTAQLVTMPVVTRHVSVAIRSMFQELSKVWTGKQAGYILKCRALLEEILYGLIRQNSSINVNTVHYEMMESIRQYIQEHYDQMITAEELAAKANISPSHFRMLFKRVVGMTANQYLVTVRIGKAKDLLLSGEMNVSEVAACTGYRDIFYFSRQFKSMTGHPPSYYIP